MHRYGYSHEVHRLGLFEVESFQQGSCRLPCSAAIAERQGSVTCLER
jgi:hypothetical protein